jgi:hypothetical protein
MLSKREREYFLELLKADEFQGATSKDFIVGNDQTKIGIVKLRLALFQVTSLLKKAVARGLPRTE